MISSVGLVIIWIAVAIVALIILLWFFPVTLWFQALISGVRISLIQLVLMRWRKVPPSTIVMAMVTGTKAGLKLDANALEAHYLAKGNVPNVVNALISADKANINLDFKMAAAIDLAGRDVFEAVQMSVNPKVINTPPVTAVAKDQHSARDGCRQGRYPDDSQGQGYCPGQYQAARRRCR